MRTEYFGGVYVGQQFIFANRTYTKIDNNHATSEGLSGPAWFDSGDVVQIA
ncbi:hypothetical protein [Klebsiella aerogenes]|uniref:hypothetical protein n=1 Tax=Klebsiella aerogenes TaxID=548 RepID=UPI001865B912|nr:hypothetical protein [Klebsiella aerogenes]